MKKKKTMIIIIILIQRRNFGRYKIILLFYEREYIIKLDPLPQNEMPIYASLVY